MIYVGVKAGHSLEWLVPESARARWIQLGGRILREAPSDALAPDGPILFDTTTDRVDNDGEITSLYPAFSLPIETTVAKRARGRPPGARNRRGQSGGDSEIVERISRED